MPISPAMFGMGGPGGGGGDGMATPGQPNPQNDMALSALGQLNPKSPNPTTALKNLERAYDLAHKLLMTSLPQLVQWNPKAAKDAHAAARMLLNIKGDLMREMELQPPPDMMSGFGMAGTPGPLGPASASPTSGLGS